MRWFRNNCDCRWYKHWNKNRVHTTFPGDGGRGKLPPMFKDIFSSTLCSIQSLLAVPLVRSHVCWHLLLPLPTVHIDLPHTWGEYVQIKWELCKVKSLTRSEVAVAFLYSFLLWLAYPIPLMGMSLLCLLIHFSSSMTAVSAVESMWNFIKLIRKMDVLPAGNAGEHQTLQQYFSQIEIRLCITY